MRKLFLCLFLVLCLVPVFGFWPFSSPDKFFIIKKEITNDVNGITRTELNTVVPWSDSNVVGGAGRISWTELNAVVPWSDANVADDITLTNITQITNRAFTNITNRNFSLLNLDDNSSFDSRYVLSSDLNNQTVSRIIAGTNITISPLSGIGVVTINSSGGGGGSYTSAGLPIVIDNDTNTIGLSVQPTSDWNGLFDGHEGSYYLDGNVFEIDGGFANSVYLLTQIIDGGGA